MKRAERHAPFEQVPLKPQVNEWERSNHSKRARRLRDLAQVSLGALADAIHFTYLAGETPLEIAGPSINALNELAHSSGWTKRRLRDFTKVVRADVVEEAHSHLHMTWKDAYRFAALVLHKTEARGSPQAMKDSREWYNRRRENPQLYRWRGLERWLAANRLDMWTADRPDWSAFLKSHEGAAMPQRSPRTKQGAMWARKRR